MLSTETEKKITISTPLYQTLEKYAASVSVHCECTVTPDNFIHYLIQHYAESASDNIIAALEN
ncbi:hypothetical protein [Candidatus Regiella endosymbiont of Tuberolachnus salignus]|uniref:hypothetical protein n=1 Tax=Candidatus Regiella endosymbiont of Tuberolachnus salignus TaxID=3077956 RepID=UPI0030CFB2E5